MIRLNIYHKRRRFCAVLSSRRGSIAGYATEEDRGIGRKRPLYWFEVKLTHSLIY